MRMNSVGSAKVFGVVLLLASCSHSDASRGPSTPPPISVAAGSDAQPERIDLMFSNEDIYEAFRTLAQKAGISLFLDSNLDGRVTLAVQSVPWPEALETLARDHKLRVERLNVRGVQAPSFWVSRRSSPPAPQREFTGERVTMRFDNTPIREAVKQLADAAKTNILVDDGVGDIPITLNLRLPWDLGLAHLAQKYELHLLSANGTIRVTP